MELEVNFLISKLKMAAPHCGAGFSNLIQVRAEYKDKVRHVSDS